jgi:hypothetical protein
MAKDFTSFPIGEFQEMTVETFKAATGPGFTGSNGPRDVDNINLVNANMNAGTFADGREMSTNRVESSEGVTDGI